MRKETLWEEQKRKDPGRSSWYIERFEKMRAEGADLHGEARLIDAMTGRGSRILDAGSGSGRVGGELARLGHDVTGVDVDPELVAASQQDHPNGTWITGDLAELDTVLPPSTPSFDLVVCAGNVLTFVAPGTETRVLRQLRAVLAGQGRLVTGFGAGRGYKFDRFFVDAESAGLKRDAAFATWDLRPFTPSSDFLVAVFSGAAGDA